jgi:3-oxoacyl-[acyl-carrier protein] reductase
VITFEGQTVLVTGSTRGIGRAVAVKLSSLGASVIVTGTSADQPFDISSVFGEKAVYIQGDFASKEGIDRFIHELDRFPEIHACVNNAGINRLNPVEDVLDQDYRDLFTVNVDAPFQICRYLAPKMKTQKYGRIVNVASIWSVITKPKRSVYTMTKNAIVGMTETFAIELAPFGICVNAISPGFTMTELTKSTLTEQDYKDLSKQVPASRFAEPDEIANVIVFLSSSTNSYMTAQNIIVDGGFTHV